MLAGRAGLRPLPALRRMVSAGEPLNPEVIEVFREALGLDICDGYGQTETGHLTGNLVGDAVRDGSMGKPLPGIQVRIADGELQVQAASCPTFFSGYLDGEPFAGEWWPTGDLVSEDGDGYLWFEGRRDDLILSAGYRIGPFEVESALLSHPAVAEAAAVSAPDPERGAVVRAIVVLREARAERRPRPGASGALQAGGRPLQVPAHRRVRRPAAEDDEREDQAGGAAGRRVRREPVAGATLSPGRVRGHLRRHAALADRGRRRAAGDPALRPRAARTPATSRSAWRSARSPSPPWRAGRWPDTSPTCAAAGRSWWSEPCSPPRPGSSTSCRPGLRA